ncbi:HlyC/CorC family transporter, partial [candidate division TA06 bacterium]|nr:HlyC/CorC family transporter [candidate division TA06 bacterium]
MKFFSWLFKRSIRSEEELREMIAHSEDVGIITEAEEEMIESIFELEDTQVKEVMVPRVDMVSVDARTPMEEVIRLHLEKGYSRIPVVDGTKDEPVGILYVNELLRFWGSQENLKAIELIHLPYYIPQSKRVLETLQEFQEKNISIALVVDEYGGVCGLVTMEDLIEEIVGELRDELDKEEIPYQKMKDGSYIMNARVGLEDLNELLGTAFQSEEVHTLGGLILNRLERIPTKGEIFDIDGLKIQ